MVTCECGCNQEAKNRFVHGHNTRLDVVHRAYKGGNIDKKGYHRVGRKNVMSHRRVYEKFYNCCLLPIADIHHKDGNKLNNKIENLEPMWHRHHTLLHDPRKWLGKKFSEKHKNNIRKGVLKNWEKRRLL